MNLSPFCINDAVPAEIAGCPSIFFYIGMVKIYNCHEFRAERKWRGMKNVCTRQTRVRAYVPMRNKFVHHPRLTVQRLPTTGPTAKRNQI